MMNKIIYYELWQTFFFKKIFDVLPSRIVRDIRRVNSMSMRSSGNRPFLRAIIVTSPERKTHKQQILKNDKEKVITYHEPATLIENVSDPKNPWNDWK